MQHSAVSRFIRQELCKDFSLVGAKRRGVNKCSAAQTAAEIIQFQFQTQGFIDSWVVTQDLYRGIVCLFISEDNKTG